MSHEPISSDAKMREEVYKSAFSGVAATVLAVTLFSPAGFGGTIGTSLASGFGADSDTTPADDVYARLPPFPSPMSPEELADIRGQIARTTASLAITRAATDARIEQLRALSASADAVSFTPMASVGQIGAGLAVTGAVAAPSAPMIEHLPMPAAVALEQPRATHLELAALLLAHENI